MSLATIIITNYNKAPFLKEAIDSALNQNFEDFDVLITDDGSTDESMNIINEYQNNSKISIISKRNEGVINTRNRAINEARGKYIVQLENKIPKFKIFINIQKKPPQLFQKFFDNSFRSYFKLDGVPILYDFKTSKNPYIR